MKKKSLLFLCLLFPLTGWCEDDVLAIRERLSPEQLLSTGDRYYSAGQIDSALVYYNLLTGIPVNETDTTQLRRIVEAYNRAAIIYFHMGAYRNSYELLLNALPLAERSDYVIYETSILLNIGNIYYRFHEYDKAKAYYFRALKLHQSGVSMVTAYNNMGIIESELGKTDSAFYYLRKSMQVSRQNNDIFKYGIQNSIASVYQKEKQYDSAFYYYRSALAEARKQHRTEEEVYNLSDLGKLHFELNQIDSARFYIARSSKLADESNVVLTLAENYLTLSKIERSRGDSDSALAYFEQYATLRDSIFNTKIFGDINQLERIYEVQKINRQIEQLTVEQQIKERTIVYHRIIQTITLLLLLSAGIVLLVVFRQKRKLDTAYKTLFEKNLELIDFQTPREKQPDKDKKMSSPDIQDDLLGRILAVMEEEAVIYDPKFSINMLAGLVQANHQYVSQVINSTFRKNFRTFLNSYRIREAQRLFAEPESAKYTIESVALQVGFKSRSTFREAFKEVTGISPNFYLKSVQENRKLADFS